MTLGAPMTARKNVVTLSSARRTPVSPMQKELFVIDDPHHTNTIELWDIAPRWVFYTDPDFRQNGRFLNSVEREFEHAGRMLRLVLKPARIKRDGKDYEEFPGQREQLIEDVIRRIASERGRLMIEDEERVGLEFSLNEIRTELEKRNHGFPFWEIKEGLQILHGAQIEISYVDTSSGKPEQVSYSGSTFPQLKLRERGQDSQSWVQFNDLIATALRSLRFWQFDYEQSMRIKDPIARWLYKRLFHTVMLEGPEAGVVIIPASLIHQTCGWSNKSRWRDALKRISRSVTAIENEGVATAVDVEDRWERLPMTKRKVDAVYTIHLSERFLDEVKASRARYLANLDDYRQVMGTPPKSFADMDIAKKDQFRRIKAKRSGEPKKTPRLI